jgi:hypothetical protein
MTLDIFIYNCLMMVPQGPKHVAGNKYSICKILIDYKIICCGDGYP